MEKKFKLFLIVALSVLFLQGVFTLIWSSVRKNKTAYIKTEQVYNGFGLKKRLETDLKKTVDIRQHLLDSLRLQLDLFSMQLQDKNKKADSNLVNSFSSMRENYFRRQEEFRQSNESLAKQYTDQVWAQLNQYLADYGHQKGYEYIFGANGDGALMFADDAVNITDDVSAYVNTRFNGQP